jgi:hypothetical protein
MVKSITRERVRSPLQISRGLRERARILQALMLGNLYQISPTVGSDTYNFTLVVAGRLESILFATYQRRVAYTRTGIRVLI